MGSAICHVEIPVRNMSRAKKFYAAVFGWRFKQFAPSYVMFSPGGGIGGALTKVDEVKADGGAVIYLKVEDMKASLKLAKSSGGKVELGRQEIGGENGFIAKIRDSEGNLVGLWSAG
jgi:hypothetical protein